MSMKQQPGKSPVDHQPEMSVYEQEELLCTVLTQHLLRHTSTGIPDLKPIWFTV